MSLQKVAKLLKNSPNLITVVSSGLYYKNMTIINDKCRE
jgi:hypothetical protein